MSSNRDDDGVIVDIDPRQLDLTLDQETEKRAKPKDEDVREEKKPAKDDELRPAGDDAIEVLRRQLATLEAENERKSIALQAKEREAAEARTAVHQVTGYAHQRDYDLANTNIANAKSRSETIKRELRAARDSGNTDLESDLIVENARIGATLEREETKKREIEVRYQRETAAREAEAKAPKPAADPLEAAIQNVSAKSQAWLRAHPECVMDEEKNARVRLADIEAKRKGFAVDTPEYFSYIEETMGYRKPQRDEDESEEVETRQTAKPERRTYAAPPSRDSSNGSGLKPSQRRLTREQVDTAEALGMTPAQYATWLAKAEKDGKYVNH